MNIIAKILIMVFTSFIGFLFVMFSQGMGYYEDAVMYGCIIAIALYFLIIYKYNL